jgi:hypothetical protein
MNSNQSRIALWAGPRDVATLLMYSFSSRKDTLVSDEPLHGYYLGFSGQDRFYREDVLRNMELDPVKVMDTLLHCDLSRKYLFVKNVTNQIIGMQWDFLTAFRNIILIQRPEEMIEQYRRHIPGIELLDLSYEVQHHVLLYLIEQGIEPIVILDTDLLHRPMETLDKLCRKLEIPYDPAMLQWPKGTKSFDGIWAKYWYQQVWETTTFSEFRPQHAPLPPELDFMLRKARPHFDKLLRYAI